MAKRVVQFCDHAIGNPVLAQSDHWLEGVSAGFERFELLRVQMGFRCPIDDRPAPIIRRDSDRSGRGRLAAWAPRESLWLASPVYMRSCDERPYA